MIEEQPVPGAPLDRETIQRLLEEEAEFPDSGQGQEWAKKRREAVDLESNSEAMFS